MALVLAVACSNLQAQCIPQLRKYATIEQSYSTALASVTAGSSATDGDVSTASNLSVGIGVLNLINATQYLGFTSGTSYVSANTPVTVKISLPTSLLGVLDNVEIQPYKNLNYDPGLFGVGARWQADAVGSPFTGAALVNLVNGVGELEFTITPTQQYQGVWIKIGSVVGLGVTAKVYHAYIRENAPSTASCNNIIDVLTGVKPALIGGVLDATASINNPWNTTDGDPSTFSELNAGIQLLGQVFHTTVFKTPAVPGDVIQIILGDPGGGVLNLSVLSGFTIQLYNGSTPIGAAIGSSSSGLLSLSLLPGAAIGDNRRVMTLKIPASYGSFDRIQIKMGGVATVGLVPGLRVYEVNRVILPSPTIDGTESTSKSICLGNTATLAVNETQDCTTYKWYNVSVGGTALATAASYTPTVGTLALGNNIFYVEAIRANCTETSGRIPVTITVNTPPSITLGSAAAVCAGALQTSLAYTATTANPTTYSISWSTSGLPDVLSAAFPATSPILITLPNNAVAKTYNGTITVSNGTSCSASPVNFSFVINPKLPIPTLSITSN